MEEDLQRKAIKQRLKQFYGSDTNSSLTDRDDPLNIDSPSFDAHLYLDKSLKTKDLSDLISEEKVLTEQIRSLDSDMQTLVYDNYSKFINATDTIRMMKSNFSYVEAEMNLLLQNIGSIVSVSGTINESLADKRKKLSTLTTTQLTLNKLNYLVELPLSLRKYMNKCDWDQTVLDLNKAKYILKSYHNTPSFRSIREDCAEIISEICSRLWRQFEESSDVTECSNHLKILQQLGFSSQKLSRAILRLAKRQISQRLSYIKTLVCEVDKPDINRDEALDSSVNFGNDFVHEPPPGERDILYFANLITDSVLIKLSGFIRLLADFYFTKSDESEPMDTILDIISGKTENSSSETDSGCFDEYLSNVVEELMHEFFILVRNRFELESTNTDINLLIRALDRIYCRVQTFNRSLLASVTSIDIEGEVDDLNPQSLSIVSHLSLLTNRFSNSALEIISQVARVQTTYYFDILCQNAVESFTDLRHKLASHGLQTLASNSTSEEVNKINKGENDIRQLSSLLDSLSSSLVSQLRNVLSAEETAVCKVPGPILLILGKLCLMWADSGTVGHLISLADDFMLLGLQTKETGKDFNVEDVSRPITTVKDISNRFKCTGNELLITFVRLEGTNLAQLLRKSVEARDWLKNLEPRTVRSAVKRVIEDLVLLDHQVSQLFSSSARNRDRISDSRSSRSLRPSTSSHFIDATRTGSSGQGVHAVDLDPTLATHLRRLFTQRVDIFSAVDANRESLLLGVIKIGLKTLIECARLQTFGRYGLQQIQVDCRYLQIHLWHFVNDEKLICMLLEDVIYSVVQRCVDPSFMEESVSLTVKSNYF
ncbi:Vacuolar protein sorting-associated protein 51 like [Schistosoma japonicum]|nr:Vacuolar protein sorting-associated protein 51 like [Schistosoma japonicum]